MSSLAKLQSAKSLDDLAAILGYKPAALAYLLYLWRFVPRLVRPRPDGRPG